MASKYSMRRLDGSRGELRRRMYGTASVEDLLSAERRPDGVVVSCQRCGRRTPGGARTCPECAMGGRCLMCGRFCRPRSRYCSDHRAEANLETVRLAMARYRMRLRLKRLQSRLTEMAEGGLDMPTEVGLGTGNLYGDPVRGRGGRVDFREERHRVEREMRRLGLRPSRATQQDGGNT
jgi:hypothetical protein